MSERLWRFRARRLVTVQGDWHLWLYCCDWFLFAHGERVRNSENNIEKVVKELNGQRLTAVTVNQLPGRSVFEFDLGARLCTRPHTTRRQDAQDAHTEQWHLYEPSGRVLGFRADGLYSHQSGNTQPDQQEWAALRPGG